MRTHSLAALGAAAFLTLGLAGCAVDTPAPAGDTTTEEESTEDTGGGSMLVLPGTGEYETGDTIPIGGYQVSGEPDSLPDGCTWTLYADNGDVAAENNGIYVFITDVTGTFVTNGCPDWEQFE